MRKAFAAAGFMACAAWAGSAAAADAVLYGSLNAVRMLKPYSGLMLSRAGLSLTASTSGTGQLVLDVIDGKESVAAIAMPLAQAVAAAREAAWAEGRTLKVPETLQFREVSSLRKGETSVGFVTVGAPSAALEQLLSDLR